MSNEPSTLLEVISQHRDQTLIDSAGGKLTPSLLDHAVKETRGRYPELASSGVALQFSNSSELITCLIALDGHARRILLLPPCMERPALEQVVATTEVSYHLTDKGLSALGPDSLNAVGGNETEWLFMTSGTSGSPKVFSHTLRSLSRTINTGAANSRQYRWGLAYEPHRFAGIQVILQALFSGGLLVVPESGNINSQVDYMAQHRVNALSATPSQWRKFLIHGAIKKCPLRQITLGGEIADQAILHALGREFPAARIAHIYASTEAGVGFSVTDREAGFPLEWLGPGPPADMKISGNGTLLIKSEAISPSKSLHSRMTPDGYLDTEDCVEVSNDRVNFLGRASGAINVGGNKVHPEEVENIVRELPGVENAAVSGRSNPIMGQLVYLEVQAGNISAEQGKRLKNQIRDHCRQHLPKYKVPALISFVDKLAISTSGKLDRKGST